jgi:hypothetical protein
MRRRRRIRKAPAADPDPAVFTTTPAARGRLTVVDRYVSRRFLGFFLLVLLSASALYEIVEAQGLMEDISEGHQPMSLALKYLAYFTPGMLKIVTPIACLVAAMITLGTMARANEDTALKAAGVSIFRISAPLLFVTLGLSFGYFLVQDYVAPYTNRKASYVRDEIEGRASSATVAGTRWVFGKENRLYAYGDYNTATRTPGGLGPAARARPVPDPPPHPGAAGRGGPAGMGRRQRLGAWVLKLDEEPIGLLENSVLAWPETPDDFARQALLLHRAARRGDELLRPVEPHPQDGEQRL